jgi:acetoin:2,6-dichlorophenolindophenol oxidoreductase subunit alpha
MKTQKKKPAAAPPGEAGFSLISNEKLLALYAAMLKCRMLQKHLQPARGKKRTAAGVDHGREAAVVGATIDLHAKDSISPAKSSVTQGFLKGVPLKTILSGPGRKAAGDVSLNVLAPAATVTVQLEAALAVAWLNKRKRNKKIVVAFGSCGPLWSREAPELLRIAAAKKLPIIFVCDGAWQKDDFAEKSQEYGVPGMVVDGHDVVAVYRVASEAITHARRGNGPTLIECRPWIVTGTSRVHRSSGDPIRNMERYLAGKALFSRKFKTQVKQEFEHELDDASATVKSARKKAARKIPAHT